MDTKDEIESKNEEQNTEDLSPDSALQFPFKKRCAICGMEANPELQREFEGETYYFHTGLCTITFEIQLERMIAERNRLLEESRKSLGLSQFHTAAQVNEALAAHRKNICECAFGAMPDDLTTDMFRSDNRGYNDTH